MELQLTPAEQAFLQDKKAWVEQHLPKDISAKIHAGQRLHKSDMQRWAQILGKQGWLGAAWPTQFGGPGWNAVERFLFDEACALAGSPRIVPFGPVMVAPVIMAFGNAEQQKRFLPGIASGDVWWCQGYSEPGSGSDLASLKTKAVKGVDAQGEHYIVNGQKTWTTLGQHAEWGFFLVRTSSEGKPQTGISFLLIDMKSPGITVRPILTLDGEHEVNEVWLDNVRVPMDQLIGAENQGWTIAKFLLNHERANIADVNRSKRELERLKRLAKQVPNAGAPLWEDFRFRDQVVELDVDIQALEMLVLRVLAAERDGKKSGVEASMLKIRGSEIQQRLSELMMKAAGTYSLPLRYEANEQDWTGDVVGAAEYSPLAGTYFNYRKTSIYGGSNEIQKNIISQQLLAV
jgi:alkylation response protein AidB-like acyl-CoA dehydrogenase